MHTYHSPPSGASCTQPSPATADAHLRIWGGKLLYPMCEASSPCGETGRNVGNGGRKTIIDNSQWVHSTSALTATGFLSCPPLSSPSTTLLPHPAQPLDQKIFSFLLPPFPVVVLAEFIKKKNEHVSHTAAHLRRPLEREQELHRWVLCSRAAGTRPPFPQGWGCSADVLGWA